MLCKLTANLYSSKTDFLLIGLKQQLAKINSNSLDTVHSARNLGQARIQKARLRGRPGESWWWRFEAPKAHAVLLV